jgi:hypothetical protein
MQMKFATERKEARTHDLCLTPNKYIELNSKNIFHISLFEGEGQRYSGRGTHPPPQY